MLRWSVKRQGLAQWYGLSIPQAFCWLQAPCYPVPNPFVCLRIKSGKNQNASWYFGLSDVVSFLVELVPSNIDFFMGHWKLPSTVLYLSSELGDGFSMINGFLEII